MPKKPDLLDLRILEGLGIYGPRNVSNAARKLGIKTDTLRKRLTRMRSHFFFRFAANIYCTYLGLMKAVVFAESVPGFEDLLFDCLKSNDFWIYVARCYGINEGCTAIYTIPKDHQNDFVQFIEALEKMGIARNFQVFWTTCFQGVNSKIKWFDEKSRQWVLNWSEWIQEIPSENTKLPRTLVDPKDYPIMGDETDVFILKELEKNPRISIKDLSKALKTSQPVVNYHYQKHIIERNLIESFEVLTLQWDMSVSDRFIFKFEFDSMEKYARFASSLLDKPFVGGIGKILNKYSLIVDIHLPKLAFREFVDTLSKLVRESMLSSYSYLILDLRNAKRQTISYEYFKNGAWVYDHNKHLKNLMDLASITKFHPSKTYLEPNRGARSTDRTHRPNHSRNNTEKSHTTHASA
jgi:DNA-binding Lrp family transcriptional regulator